MKSLRCEVRARAKLLGGAFLAYSVRWLPHHLCSAPIKWIDEVQSKTANKSSPEEQLSSFLNGELCHGALYPHILSERAQASAVRCAPPNFVPPYLCCFDGSQRI
jgi:hypothetical protein